MIQVILKKNQIASNYFMKQICSSSMYLPCGQSLSFSICLARDEGEK